MRNRATDLLVLMLLAACGGAGHSTATAEAADSPAAAAPMVESTTYLGPFAGEGAALHPDNVKPQPIAFYGTDLGFTYQHGEQLQILFGDSWATERYAPIEASTGSRFDDGFGTIDVRKGFDPASITPTSHSSDQARAEPGHDRDVGDRSRARDGSRQDTDGRLQQRHARIRRVQHRQAAGLHEGCGVQQRPRMRHDPGLFRQPVLAAGERHSSAVGMARPVAPATRWSMRRTSPFRRAGCARTQRARCATGRCRTC